MTGALVGRNSPEIYDHRVFTQPLRLADQHDWRTPHYFWGNSSGRQSVADSKLYDDVNDAERLSIDPVKQFHQILF